MNIKDELTKRNLPDILLMNDGSAVTEKNWAERKKELLDILSENLFGFTPPPPKKVEGIEGIANRFKHFGGKAVSETRIITFDTPKGDYSFPVEITIPTGRKNPPVIVYLSFGSNYPFPEEEIIERGFGVATVNYQDITPDTVFGDFTSGLAGMFIGDREREESEWGLVGLWAYGASRIMDYLVTRNDINVERIAVAGHSRLGKTALWCRAQDPRFYMAYGNNGNYGGCGIIRGHVGEDVPAFIRIGSYNFFCEKFKTFENVPHAELPYDMNFLMACQAPGYAFVTGATNDGGMDPLSEYLSMVDASRVYKLLGKRGLVSDEKMPSPAEPLIDGEMGFYVRRGRHFMSREDWNVFMDFFEKNM